MRVTVLGGGSWGTALAHLFAEKGLTVSMLVRDPAQADAITTQHTNPRYLGDLPLAKSLTATTDAATALRDADVCLLAIPCQHLRENLTRLAPLIPVNAIPVCASKGIEIANLCRMEQVVQAALPQQAARYAILSGPSFANEVVQGKPTAIVLGCADASTGEMLREQLSTPLFRVYSSTDVIGVELGGAIKNVIAIAAGLCDGLALGHNSRAALITRGLAEISRLGLALGAKPATFMGLSGLGDLVLTCTGDLSRNRQVGLRLAAGDSMETIATAMHMVAEGVKTTEAVCRLAEQLDVELPIAFSIRRILTEGTMPRSLVHELMTRTLREE